MPVLFGVYLASHLPVLITCQERCRKIYDLRYLSAYPCFSAFVSMLFRR